MWSHRRSHSAASSWRMGSIRQRDDNETCCKYLARQTAVVTIHELVGTIPARPRYARGRGRLGASLARADPHAPHHTFLNWRQLKFYQKLRPLKIQPTSNYASHASHCVWLISDAGVSHQVGFAGGSSADYVQTLEILGFLPYSGKQRHLR